MRTHSFIWFLLVAAILVLTPMLTSKDQYREVIRAELGDALAWYGKEDSTKLVRSANAHYGKLLSMSGLDDARRITIKAGENLPRMRNGKVLGFIDLPRENVRTGLDGPIFFLYLFCWRLANYGIWLMYVAPIIAALVFDGIMTRQVYHAINRYSSPSRYNVIWHATIAFLALAALSTYVAVDMPVLGYPATLVGIGLMARAMMANLQSSA